MGLLKLRNNVLNDIYILITYGVIFMFYYNERLMLARKKTRFNPKWVKPTTWTKITTIPKIQKRHKCHAHYLSL